MKNKNIKWMFVLGALLALMVAGCDDGDADVDFGYALIFMPQAREDIYVVPGGGGPYTYNFVIDWVDLLTPDKIHVFLSVTRTGKLINNEGFSVDIVPSTEKTAAAIASGEITNPLAMPATVYTMPERVTVEPGKNSASFFLTINAIDLMRSAYTNRNLTLAIELRNPSNYELNELMSTTILTIDVDEMRGIMY